MEFTVGLTGGIGSGKSAASRWFEQQGICVVDADIVAREIVEIGQPTLQQIKEIFGNWVLLENGALNRRALRDHIFTQPDARLKLEAITHPAIRQEIIRQLTQTNSRYNILVSPLLFETTQHELVNRTLLIDASEDIQIQRASQRDGQTIVQIKQIITAQMPRAEKLKRADDIVLNDGHLEHLYQQLMPLHQMYLQQS